MSGRCTCGCCEGVAVLTPMPTANRPGLDALSYRVGTHATFLETMKARLSSAAFPELRGLTTRAADDPSVALLDAWATVGDVLTFYQERIANEGYLRTAIERRSLLEIARLVGYRPRPGVAASVPLAFTMEQGQQVVIPAGARSQSLPGPGELPQSFETSDPLEARAEWNTLPPRLTRQPRIALRRADGAAAPASIDREMIYIRGVAAGLRVGDRLLFVFGPKPDDMIVRRVEVVELQLAENRTKVRLQEAATAAATSEPRPLVAEGAGTPLGTLGSIRRRLVLPPAEHPANPFRLPRDIAAALGGAGDLVPQLLSVDSPALGDALYTAWAHAGGEASGVEVYVLRQTTALFGHNALEPTGRFLLIPARDERPDTLYLDGAFDGILDGSYVVVQRADESDPRIFAQVRALTGPRTAYQITGNATRITLADGQTWWQPRGGGENSDPDPNPPFDAIRGTVVYAQSEALRLADDPIDPVSGSVGGKDVELASVFGALQAGRWLIVAGERTDVVANGQIVPGIRGAELVMLAGVTHQKASATDLVHTVLHLSHDLQYRYRLDTVTIFGNVVIATHGETRSEVLGSGDPSQVHQVFALRQSPLTYLPASTPEGAATTLQLYVDDVRWRERDHFNQAGPRDQAFITRTDDDDKTTALTGDGIRGARPASGAENVKATYRTGIGEPGNVQAGQITLLITRPLGLKKVNNPIAATGGVDRDSAGAIRLNAPLAVMALDRLVSVVDYESFARTFAGIGKAKATSLSDGRRELLHVTIAGANDAPVGRDSLLLGSLTDALRTFGDTFLPLVVEPRELVVLVISAKVLRDPDHAWEDLEPTIRAALLAAFSFERRDLGQPVVLSEVISAIQQVRDVAAVDVDLLDGVPQSLADDPGAAGRQPRDDGRRGGRRAAREAHRLRGAGTARDRAGGGFFLESAGGATRPAGPARPASAGDPDSDGMDDAMTPQTDRLYELLPSVHRRRDAEQGYPLRALLRVVGEQVAVVEDDSGPAVRQLVHRDRRGLGRAVPRRFHRVPARARRRRCRRRLHAGRTRAQSCAGAPARGGQHAALPAAEGDAGAARGIGAGDCRMALPRGRVLHPPGVESARQSRPPRSRTRPRPTGRRRARPPRRSLRPDGAHRRRPAHDLPPDARALQHSKRRALRVAAEDVLRHPDARRLSRREPQLLHVQRRRQRHGPPQPAAARARPHPHRGRAESADADSPPPVRPAPR